MRHVFSEAMRSPRGFDCFDMSSLGAAGMRSADLLWTGLNTEKNAMGLKHGNEPQYTLWTHTENEKVLHRRLHHMKVQDRNGRLHNLEGDKLPEAIHTFCGQAYKGAHLATILLRPETVRVPKAAPPDTASWPNLRDVANLIVGFLGITMLRLIIALIDAL
jgi:hypothetical protein